jgi:hypothetical protein
MENNMTISSNWINIGLTILAVVILLYLIGNYYNSKSHHKEHFNNNTPYQPGLLNSVDNSPVKPSKGLGKNEEYSEVNLTNNTIDEVETRKNTKHKNAYPNDCYPKDQLNASELLPSDPNSKWAQVNPAGQGELGDQNFLDAGFHMGVNTVGQTLRNPNLQLRSEPPNPQLKVSPWMQSTIEADSNRKPMEIG